MSHLELARQESLENKGHVRASLDGGESLAKQHREPGAFARDARDLLMDRRTLICPHVQTAALAMGNEQPGGEPAMQLALDGAMAAADPFN